MDVKTLDWWSQLDVLNMPSWNFPQPKLPHKDVIYDSENDLDFSYSTFSKLEINKSRKKCGFWLRLITELDDKVVKVILCSSPFSFSIEFVQMCSPQITS